MENISKKLEIIKEKITSKNMVFNAPISIGQIHIFEQKYHIKLPKEMVIFYTEVGNGGQLDKYSYLNSIEEFEIVNNNIIKEFPYNEVFRWEEYDDDCDDEDDFTDNDDELEKIYYGNITLLDIGDGQTWNIIINGKSKGEIWLFTDIGITPCNPRKNFLDWLECWLDGNEDYFN